MSNVVGDTQWFHVLIDLVRVSVLIRSRVQRFSHAEYYSTINQVKFPCMLTELSLLPLKSIGTYRFTILFLDVLTKLQ